MDAGDYKRRHHRKRDDEDDEKRIKEKKRHHRYKEKGESRVDKCSKHSNGSLERREEHHRKRNKEEKGHSHRRKVKCECEKKTEEKVSKEKRHHRTKHQKKSRESISPDRKCVCERHRHACKNKLTRSIENLNDNASNGSLLRRYKTFHVGHKSHRPRSPSIKELISELKRRKHRARSEKVFTPNENTQVSQIWYCHIDSKGPLKHSKRIEVRPETAPRKHKRHPVHFSLNTRTRSTPENVSGDIGHYISQPSSSRAQRTDAKEEKCRLKSEKCRSQKRAAFVENIEKKAEAETNKKFESNIKSYFVKIEKLIDKKLNDYLHLKNSKLRETIEDNLKYIEQERNKLRHGSSYRTHSKHQKHNKRCEEMNDKKSLPSTSKPHKRSKSKITATKTRPEVVPVDKQEDYRDVRTISVSVNSRQNQTSIAKTKEKRKSKDRSSLNELNYKEINFEKGYLRKDNRTPDIKNKPRTLKSTKQTGDDHLLQEFTTTFNEHKKEKISKSCNTATRGPEVPIIFQRQQPTSKKDDKVVTTRNAKIQKNTSNKKTEASKIVSNRNNVEQPSTSAGHARHNFVKKTTPGYSVCNKGPCHLNVNEERFNRKPTDEFAAGERYSFHPSNDSSNNNNFIVEGVEPAKRLNNSQKASRRKPIRHLECKTVSVITIPSQEKPSKYVPLEVRASEAIEKINKMKRLKLYYQYSLDSNQCSNCEYSEEKSVISESFQIFSDYSDTTGKQYEETPNVVATANEANTSTAKDADCIEKILFKKLKTNSQNTGYGANSKDNNDQSYNFFQENFVKTFGRKSLTPDDTNNATAKEPIQNNENLRDEEETANTNINTQEKTTLNVDMTKTTLTVNNQTAADKLCQNPNHQLLKYLESMYHMYLYTLPQTKLVKEAIENISGKLDLEETFKPNNKAPELPNEKEFLLERRVGTKVDDVKTVNVELSDKTVNTSFHELCSAQSVIKVDKITSYHQSCSANPSVSKSKDKSIQGVTMTDQVTSCHDLIGCTSQNPPKDVGNQPSNNEILSKTVKKKELKSVEIMTVLAAANDMISKSVTAMTNDVEKLQISEKVGVKKATKDETIQMFDITTQNVSVQTESEDVAVDAFIKDIMQEYAKDNLRKAVIVVQNSKEIRKNNSKSKRTEKVQVDSRHFEGEDRSKKHTSVSNKNSQVTVNAEKSKSKTDRPDSNRNKKLQKTPTKNKRDGDTEKVASSNKIPKKVRQLSSTIKQNAKAEKSKRDFKYFTLNKSQSETSLPRIKSGKIVGRVSSLVCIHKYLNEDSFVESSNSCLGSFYGESSISRDQHLSCRLMLTKDYRSLQMSAYQRRKLYDDVMRNKFKKKEKQDKVSQIYEVRYITTDKDKKNTDSEDAFKQETSKDVKSNENLDDFVEETVQLLMKNKSEQLLNFIHKNLDITKRSKLIDFLQKIIDSPETLRLATDSKDGPSRTEILNFFKKLSKSLKCNSSETLIKSDASKQSTKRPTSPKESATLGSSTTSSSSKNTTVRERCPATARSEASVDLLFTDDQLDCSKNKSKLKIEPKSVECAVKSDTNIKKAVPASFVKSQNSEESGYMSSGKSKFNTSLSNFFKNPNISELLKPQMCFGRSFSSTNDILIEEGAIDTPPNSPNYSSYEEIQNAYFKSSSSALDITNIISKTSMPDIMDEEITLTKSESLLCEQNIQRDADPKHDSSGNSRTLEYCYEEEVPSDMYRDVLPDMFDEDNAKNDCSLPIYMYPQKNMTPFEMVSSLNFHRPQAIFEEVPLDGDIEEITEENFCSDQQDCDTISEDVLLESSCSFASKRSVKSVNSPKKCSKSKVPENKDGSLIPSRVKSDTSFEKKTRILNTIQYVNECGSTVYSQQMQLYTEIIENDSEEDMLVLRRLLDSGVYLIATNFNTGYITLVIDTREKTTDETKTNIPDQQRRYENSYEHYDVSSCNNASDVRRLMTQKFFENLLHVYERETILSSMLFDDKDFIENQLYSSVRQIGQTKKGFGRRMRSFLRKIFSSKPPKLMDKLPDNCEEKIYPLDEYYQRNFQLLANNAIQHFSLLVEAVTVNSEINGTMNVNGFLTLLQKIKSGHFTFLKAGENMNFEEDIKNQVKQAFHNLYLTVHVEARNFHRKLTKKDMNLVGAFVCKYRIGLLTRIDLIASYLGKGFFETELELKAAVIYIMKVLTSIIELEDFENYCRQNRVE